ncbi:hypothetical protein D3C84_527600 [compost metagenome]
MAPAKTQTAVEFDGTAAIEAGEVERQNAVERTVGEGQQFFAGDHRHRALVGGGVIDGVGAVAVGVGGLFRGVVPLFVTSEAGAGGGLFARHGDRVRHLQHR